MNVNCVKIYSSFPSVVEEVCGVEVVDFHVLLPSHFYARDKYPLYKHKFIVT